MSKILELSALIVAISTICGFAYKVHLSIKRITEGQKCLLRSQIVETYYKYKDAEEIPEFAKQNTLLLYEAYTQLGGNSFVQDLITQMRTWEVVR